MCAAAGQQEPPETSIDEARKALSVPIAVLLGAGASVDAGVPASYLMTQKIVDAVNANPSYRYDHQAWALNFVCGALEAHNTARGSSYRAGLDVEFVASAVALLADRDNHEAAPFVQSWHPAVEEIDLPPPPHFLENRVKQALSASAGQIETVIRDSVRQHNLRGTGRIKTAMESGGQQLMRAVSELIDTRAGRGTGRVYRQLQQTMTSELCNHVRIAGASAVNYLSPLVTKARERSSMVIATLNYDRSIEIVCQANGMPCETGIVNWSQTRTFSSVDSGIDLLKLHGSVDWAIESNSRAEPGYLPGLRVTQLE